MREGALQCWSALPQGETSVTVNTALGLLRGVRRGGVNRFLGIPYAASTDGRNRFAAPRQVPPWAGVRDALHLGQRCPQERETYGDAPIFSWYTQTEPFSEDCCVLNVFTPGLGAARRPVMVYIHGGGQVTGGGGGKVLDGSNLAKFGDVVVVTVNHRLNIFGYLNLGHLDAEQFVDSANAGQLDLIAALEWVQYNIAAFGGDPGCVTLFGQSGGGSKIMALMAMPSAKGLFHRAINMSGSSGVNLASAHHTEDYANAFLSHLGISKATLPRLREMPVESLLAARRAAVTKARDGSRPVVDGRHVTASPISEKGLQLHASVPLLLGTTATEASFYFSADPRHLRLTETQVLARLKAQFRLDDDHAKDVVASYRDGSPSRSASDVLMALISDTLFRLPLIRAAEAKSDARHEPVFFYEFCWKAPVDLGIWGSPHAIDIPFAFGNTAQAQSLTGIGEEPDEVSLHLMSAFVAFARTGNPDNDRMPSWQAYDRMHRTTMLIDRECRSVQDHRQADRLAGSNLRLDPYDRAALFTYQS